MQIPMWPGQYYQHPNTPLGMFYPPSWGGYTYLMQQQIHDDEQMNTDDTLNTKGKRKASEEELQQQTKDDEEYRIRTVQHDIENEPILPEVLEITRRIHRQDRVGELEQRLAQAHESLATALQRNQQLEHDLAHADQGTKQPLSHAQGDLPTDPSNK
ncbi:hypothetical protein IW262DRAFT_1302485 [Armillaria fumosa]|nr:hypothetical protein IW262DRAFT_1302485 [Armillaria fumosa]